MSEPSFGPLADLGPLVLRIFLGIVFLAHARLKVQPNVRQGVMQVAGWLRSMRLPLPGLAAWGVLGLESLGAVLLMLGLGTRILGALYALEMLAIILIVKRGMKIPFLAIQTTGWELDFAVLAGVLSLVFTGAGAIALDRALGL